MRRLRVFFQGVPRTFGQDFSYKNTRDILPYWGFNGVSVILCIRWALCSYSQSRGSKKPCLVSKKRTGTRQTKSLHDLKW